MKSLLLTCLLLFCFPALAQTSNVIRVYDRFENRTRYWTRPAYVSSGLDMRATFSFKGKGAGHDIEGFALVFSSVSSDWRYLKNSRLLCLIDEKAIDLGLPKSTDNDVSTTYKSVEVKEWLVFRVDYRFLQTLSNAKQAEMRLGDSEFGLKQYVLSDIKELLSKVEVVEKPRKSR